MKMAMALQVGLAIERVLNLVAGPIDPV